MVSRFHSGYFPPPPARSTRGISSDLYCENLVKLLMVKYTEVGGLPSWASLDTESLAIHQVQFSFSLPRNGSYRGFCRGKLWFSVFISPILAPWRDFFDPPKKSCWFSTFYLLVGWIANCQTTYTPDWKPEVC